MVRSIHEPAPCPQLISPLGSLLQARKAIASRVLMSTILFGTLLLDPYAKSTLKCINVPEGRGAIIQSFPY